MNQKITLPRLASILSEHTGLKSGECGDFVRELFAVVCDSLQKGENVKIKGFGTFKLLVVEPRKSVDVTTGEDIEIPSHTKISFVPAKELAALVNDPFEMFETVEISDDISNEDLGDISVDDFDIEQEAGQGISGLCPVVENDVDSDINKDAEITSRQDIPLDGISDNSESGFDGYVLDDEYMSEDDVVVGKDIDVASETVDDIPDICQPEAACVETSEEDISSDGILAQVNGFISGVEMKEDVSMPGGDVEKDVDEGHLADASDTAGDIRRIFGRGFAGGFLTALVLIGVAFLIVWIVEGKDFGFVERKISSEDVVVIDSLSVVGSVASNIGSDSTMDNKDEVDVKTACEEIRTDVDTQPSDKVVYDMITDTRYLTTMAKEHYGNYHLWPYIYEENSSRLGHPNRIRPGTKVVVPSLSKYGVDPDNPRDIAKAKKLGIAIYARYE